LATERSFASRRAAGRELARQRAGLPPGLPARGRALAQNNDGPAAALGAAIGDDPPPPPQFGDESLFAGVRAGVLSLLPMHRLRTIQAA